MTTKQEPIAVSDITEAFTVPGTGTINLGQRGVAKKGDVWLDKDGGRRLILSIATGQVWFIKDAQAYIQPLEDFADDVGFAQTYAKVAPGMKVAAQLIEIEMAFLEGVITALGWPALVGVATKGVVAFVVEHRKDFPKWEAAARSVLLGRKILKTHAPTLYEMLFAAAALDFLAKWKDSSPQMLSAKDTAKLVGGLFSFGATAGFQTLLKGVLAALSLFAKGATVYAKTVGPGVAKQYAKPAEIVATFMRLGYVVTVVSAEKMLAEYKAHPVDVKKGLDYLHEALVIFSKLQKK